MTFQHCPDCGTAPGQPHTDDCDIQRCSACGKQRITCSCEGHNPMRSVWTASYICNPDELNSTTPKIELWCNGNRLDVIENVQTTPEERSYDMDVASLVEEWAASNIHARYLGGKGLSYTQAVALYAVGKLEARGPKEVPELEPMEQSSNLIDGTWYLSSGKNLLAVVAPDGEVWEYDPHLFEATHEEE